MSNEELIAELTATLGESRARWDSIEERERRARAAATLGELGGPRAVDALLDALRLDEDPDVKQYAASGLGRLSRISYW